MRSAAAADTDQSAWTPALPGWSPRSEPEAAQETQIAHSEATPAGEVLPGTGMHGTGTRALPEQRTATECPAALAARDDRHLPEICEMLHGRQSEGG